MLYTDWSDEIEDYEPEGGCASDIDADELPIKDLQPCMYTYFRILGGYWCEQDDGLGIPEIEEVDGRVGYTGLHLSFLDESQSQEETQESQSRGFGMAPEEFQKNFEKSLNISEKVNITEAKEASELMMRFMTQDADVVKFMTDMKFDYKDLHMVDNYFNKSS